jgi:hypothetical protein
MILLALLKVEGAVTAHSLRFLQEPKIESREHQYDADVCGEPFPRSMPKEQ